MAVDSLIAESVDDPRLTEHRLASDTLERRVVDQRAQVILVRQSQGGVSFVRPRHRQLERTTGVETSSARIGVNRFLSLVSRLPDRRPFGLKEGKVAHACPPSPIRRM